MAIGLVTAAADCIEFPGEWYPHEKRTRLGSLKAALQNGSLVMMEEEIVGLRRLMKPLQSDIDAGDVKRISDAGLFRRIDPWGSYDTLCRPLSGPTHCDRKTVMEQFHVDAVGRVDHVTWGPTTRDT